MFEINGTRLFVDQRGPSDGPPLLYIHGGPGQSCWDFMASVGDRFAEAGLRLIGLDQRGVLRSDPLPDEPMLSVEVLVRDFEALRTRLGIDRWTILGHSAGGGYAFEYAVERPDIVSGLILDCPCLDADATDRYRLPKAAVLLDAAGQPEFAAQCRRLASQPERISAEDRTWEVMQRLGEDYMKLFLYDSEHSVSAYQDLMESAPDSLDWSKGMSHLPLVADMYRDRVIRLNELSTPTMLVHGVDDLVAAPTVIEAFRRVVGNRTGNTVTTIPESGHFAFLEQPDPYVTAVVDFTRAVSTSS